MTDIDSRYTHHVAEEALDKIKALSFPADPTHYEIWYAYAARQKPQFNQALNNKLEAGEELTDPEIERIYEQHFGPSRMRAGISQIGSKVSDTIEHAIQMLNELILDTSRSRNECSNVSTKLADVSDTKTVRAIADRLINSLRDVEIRYSTLEDKFIKSRRNLDELQGALAIATTEATHDALTGLINRRQFDRLIEREIGKAAMELPLSLLVIDIDHFKKFNDKYGHLTGDSVLRLVGSALTQTVRDTDLVARYGGEEFTVILPNTLLREAIEIGERIRISVMSRNLTRRSTGVSLGSITVSLGAAAFRIGETSRELIDRADACLFRAKSRGRNRICDEGELGHPQEDAG